MTTSKVKWAALLSTLFAFSHLDTAGADPPRNESQVATMTLGHAIALADSGTNLIHLLDAKGNIVWQYPAKRPRDVWVLSNGHVLFTHGTGVKEVTRDKQLENNRNWSRSRPRKR